MDIKLRDQKRWGKGGGMARGWEHWNECWPFVMGPVGLGRFGRHGPDSIATQGSNR